MRRRIAALDGGTFYHHEALCGPRFRGFIDHRIYAPELADTDLAPFDALIVTCRTNHNLLRPLSAKLQRYLAGGGMLVVMGECDLHIWLPGIAWHRTPSNFWWWLEPAADLGLRIVEPEHPVFESLTLADATWHYHGYYQLAAGAVPLIDCEGGSILFDDQANHAPGRLIATTLDPFYHHGSFFMPAATRFLDKFLPWLKNP